MIAGSTAVGPAPVWSKVRPLVLQGRLADIQSGSAWRSRGRRTGLEIVNAEQALYVEVAVEPGILQRVDDHRCATPRRGGGVDQILCCHGLATGVDPVVDEERPGGGGQQVTPQAELDQTNPEMDGDERAEEGSARLRSNDERRPKLSEGLG